ncbi:MAG: hypothetical protein IPG75_14665 [Gemmatimonadetes bacterium]|nr:hypothetical protein [Gemmatimonadota bacterium]
MVGASRAGLNPTVFTRIFAVFWLGVLVLMFMPVLLAQTTREGLTPDNLLLWLVMIALSQSASFSLAEPQDEYG